MKMTLEKLGTYLTLTGPSKLKVMTVAKRLQWAIKTGLFTGKGVHFALDRGKLKQKASKVGGAKK